MEIMFSSFIIGLIFLWLAIYQIIKIWDWTKEAKILDPDKEKINMMLSALVGLCTIFFAYVIMSSYIITLYLRVLLGT